MALQLGLFQSSAMQTVFGPAKWNKNLQSGSAVWTCSVIWREIKGLQLALWLGLFQSSAVWTFSVLRSGVRNLQKNLHFGLVRSYRREWKGLQMALQFGLFQSAAVWAFFGPMKQNGKLAEWSCSLEFFSPAQENKRPAVALQLELFSPLQFGLFQSYEVEWRTCRVNLQLGFVKPYRRE